jgi:hypothetical protein
LTNSFEGLAQNTMSRAAIPLFHLVISLAVNREEARRFSHEEIDTAYGFP